MGILVINQRKLPLMGRFGRFSLFESNYVSKVRYSTREEKRGSSDVQNATKSESGTQAFGLPRDAFAHLTFVGSSSRFTFASPIRQPADVMALERDPLSHHKPGCWSDCFCVYSVKFLRWCVDKLFRERYIHRATMLKTIAPAPSLAGAFVANLKMFLWKNVTYVPSSGGFAAEVRVLMAQSESHASHINILLSMCEITLVERAAAVLLFGMHFFIFTLLFLIQPRMAFRLLGYLNEESVVIWTHMINDIELGKVVERPVPAAAIQYWGLHCFGGDIAQPCVTRSDHSGEGGTPTDDGNSADSNNNHAMKKGGSEEERGEKGSDGVATPPQTITLRDMVLLLRSDEMTWRDVCHAMADEMDQIRS
uniref:Alternative oxidase n=1 Tax=Trypanosoma congolense (strain IL3000) TaxID=1068625 RepID=G0UXG6_TRYCI|nr:unnamed protein product [Trypanosoma congolense IL3000]